MIEKHFNINEVAEILGVHQNTLRNWEKRGIIKPARLPGGYRRYSTSDINKVLSPQGKPLLIPRTYPFPKKRTKYENDENTNNHQRSSDFC